jgi:hypothetical protein
MPRSITRIRVALPYLLSMIGIMSFVVVTLTAEDGLMPARKLQCFSLFPLDRLKTRKKESKIVCRGSGALKNGQSLVIPQGYSNTWSFFEIFKKNASSNSANIHIFFLGGGFRMVKSLDTSDHVMPFVTCFR